MAKDTDQTTAGRGSPRRPVRGTRRQTGNQRVRILLVDDSPFNRKFMLALLQDGPYRVDTADNGAVAAKLFTEAQYDLVLMDRQMPVMDGVAATRAMRQWEQAMNRPPTPILALTPSIAPEDREACLSAGCSGFLAKPVKHELLLRAITEHCPAVRMAQGPPSSTTIVRVSSRVADLVPVFLENRRRDVAALQDALHRGDFDTVASIGHGMHGTGASYGFRAITRIGAALERAARRRDARAARNHTQELAGYLDRVQIRPE